MGSYIFTLILEPGIGFDWRLHRSKIVWNTKVQKQTMIDLNQDIVENTFKKENLLYIWGSYL